MNKAYAFINFINPLHVLLFYDKFEGRLWNKFNSKKKCEIKLAVFQGKEEIEKHHSNSSIVRNNI